MSGRWQIGPRFVCVLLIVIVALALIPSVPDTVVAQGTDTAAVCQSIKRIMPGLLQTAQRLRNEQDVYQKDLEAEYLFLNLIAGYQVNNISRSGFVNLLKATLSVIKETRAAMRKVAQQQVEIGRQIFQLRDIEEAQCASTPTASPPPVVPKPVGPSGPPSGGTGAAYDCNPNASITLTVGSHSATSVKCGNTYLPTANNAYDQMQHVPVGTSLPVTAKLSGPLAQGWVLTVGSSRREWCRVSSGDHCAFTASLDALPDPRYGSGESFFVQVHAPNGNIAGQVQIIMVWCTPGQPLLIENYRGTCG